MTTWTAADSAEADVLAHALVEGVFEHRERCPRCQSDGRGCPAVGEAIEEVLAWRRRRALLSRAEHLRRQRVRGYLAELGEGLAA